MTVRMEILFEDEAEARRFLNALRRKDGRCAVAYDPNEETDYKEDWPDLLSVIDAELRDEFASKTIRRGEAITIIPDMGPERQMRVSHVERHIITLTDV